MQNKIGASGSNFSSDYRLLYEKYWSNLIGLFHENKNISPPLLLDPPEKYMQQPHRLLIVGQQTNSWYNEQFDLNNHHKMIKLFMDIYKNKFALGIYHRRSPFWQAVRELETLLGISCGACLWTNLNKIDQAGERPYFLEEKVQKIFPVLPDEIRIANPDIIVFFTGPHYDNLIKLTLPGAKFIPMKWQNFLVRIKHDILPYNTFRTYHPGYLRRIKMQHEILSAIAKTSNSI